MAFKLRTIEKAELYVIRPTAALIGVDERRVPEWRENKETISSLQEKNKSQHRYRLEGAGRKVTNQQADELLASWIEQERMQHHRVSCKQVAKKALELFEDPNFKASRGWMQKFLNRWGFTSRRKTTQRQHLPAELCDKNVSFVKYNGNTILTYHLELGQIGNMDETAIWSDMTESTTIEIKGLKSVPILSTGHEKQRTTVRLTALVDGRKLTPFIIFKGKRIPQELERVAGVVIGMSPNGWMSEDLVIE